MGNDEYADIFHNLMNKEQLIEKFGWEEYFIFALMLGVRKFDGCSILLETLLGAWYCKFESILNIKLCYSEFQEFRS